MPAVGDLVQDRRGRWIMLAPHLVAPAIRLRRRFTARVLAAEQLAFYQSIPSYAKVIAREGVESAADLAAVGPAEAVRAQLRRYLDAGATSLVLSPLRTDSADSERLWELAASI